MLLVSFVGDSLWLIRRQEGRRSQLRRFGEGGGVLGIRNGGVGGSVWLATMEKLGRVALGLGVAVPFVYFGAQLVAAPFYPGYSFISQVASELGSDKAPVPWILNSGIFLTGLATLGAAYGFWAGLRRVGAHAVWAGMAAILLALSSIGTIKAGMYPMPDPRHSSGGFLGMTMLLFPMALLAGLWKRQDAGGVKVYLAFAIVCILCLIPIVTGRVGLDPQGDYKGLIQRVFAASVFPPIAVGAFYLRRRIQDSEIKKS